MSGFENSEDTSTVRIVAKGPTGQLALEPKGAPVQGLRKRAYLIALSGANPGQLYAIDRHVSDEAARYIAAQGPDLSWVYLEYTDDVAHANGDSEKFDIAVQQADSMVGRIYAAVQQRERLGERWMIVVTTDHGRDAVTGRGHGGRSARERTTWIATNQRPVTEGFLRGEAAIVDIVPSLLQFMRVPTPKAVAAQMEGVSFLAAP